MSDRVLVTGAAGFVGRHLTERLASTEADIVATDLAQSPPERFEEYVGTAIEYRHGDLTDNDFCERLLAEPYDRIYHLAAIVGVEDYVENPLSLVEVNVEVTKQLLERVMEWDVRFVFTSTSEVYGKNPDVPWSESDDRVLGPPTIDRWNYSTGKSLCEQMIHSVAAADNPLSATVFRPFNLYGPGQRPKFAVPAFIDAVVSGGVPTVYDEGTQTRCFTYIDDFVDGVVQASTSHAGRNEVFNLGSERETQIDELAHLVLELSGHPERGPEYIDTDELYGDTYEDLERRVPDTSKANEKLGWEAETTLEEGLTSVIEWWRENQ